MKKKISRKIISLVLAVLMVIGVLPVSLYAGPVVGTSDNGDGTYNNPVVWADIPDMSLIRVRDTYYMASTSMHMAPGVPIMASKDLVNWETISYCYMVLGDTDAMRLEGVGSNGKTNNMYKNGTWASSLNHRMVDDGNGGLKDEFILVVPAPTTNKTHVYKTSDPYNEPWQRYDMPARYHDCGILIDDDGRNWMTWGTNIREMNAELTGFAEGSETRRLIDTLHGPDPETGVTPSGGLSEGLHMKKVGDMYYIICITWPSGKPRTVVAHRAPSLDTPPEEWESKVVSQQNVNYGGGAGVAQGSIVQAEDGKWYGYAFRDSGAVGRIPWVVPVTWVDGWPMYGSDGTHTNLVPNYNEAAPIPVQGQEVKSVVASDEFYNNAKKPTYFDSNLIPLNEEPQDEEPPADDGALAPGTEVVENGGFETGNTNGWIFNNTFNDSAVLTADAAIKNGGEYSMKAAQRASTGSGPMQMTTDEIVAGGVYDVSFDVYYDHAAAPDTKTFNMTMRLASADGTSDNNRMQIMRGGQGRKGQWTTISGQYTVPEGVDDSETAFFFETNWVQSPTLDNDLFDFYVDNVSCKVVSMPGTVAPVDPEPVVPDYYKYYGSNLGMAWQWNHNPDNRFWSLTERAGWLRLTTSRVVTDILSAPNSLTQRTLGPVSAATTAVDVSNMKDGDKAGISLFTAKYGSIGVVVEGDQKYIVTMISPDNNANSYDNITDRGVETGRVAVTGNKVYLKAESNFVNQADRGNFFYSYDGINWTKLGDELRMVFHYNNNHFMGYRYALYNFATKEAGGYADFDFYRISDKLTGDTEQPLLNAAMTGQTGLDSVAGTAAAVRVMMDPLPEGGYSEIAASFDVPADLTVTDVVFGDTVTGETSWEMTGNQLELSVKGGDVSFASAASAEFATIRLSLNRSLPGSATLSVVPDYIIAKGENDVVYNTINAQGNIGFGGGAAGSVEKPIGNPYLPLWEHLPDNEPRVFDDPDNPGKLRAYITGSHDVRVGSYCGPDIRQWSAPIENLADWRDEGAIFTYQQNEGGNWDTMYAPDIVEVKRFAPEVIERGRTADDERTITEYFLYPHSTSDNGMVARSDRPDGPFEPINLGANGRSRGGSFIGFDPSVWVDYIDDPEDPDYDIGFRAYVYYGFQESNADELDQSTMWSRRPGTERIRYFMPSSDGYGRVDPNEAGVDYVGLAPGEDPADYNFFEAASMRQIGNKYIMVYSGHSGPDYGMGSTNSALRWAYGDSPLGPFKFGGVLVDSRGPIPNEDGSRLVGGQWGHNTHGSLWEINGQWYTTYHRPVMGASGNRQAVVAPLKVTYTEPSVLDGGVVTISGYDPYAEDEVWTAKADNGEYDGAEITSEGFYIYGLPPYRYYSAGYVSDHQGSATVQANRDIWDSHQPIVNARNGYRAGYKYFGFGGLDEASKGILPFDGTKEGNNTKFNLWLTPRTDAAFSVELWLDGPWANDTWNGTQIGTINVPAGSTQEVTQFTADVSEFVDGLTGKHAVYLVVRGGAGNLCDLIGLGFSSDANVISRYVSPTPSISVGGVPQAIPAAPIRSTNQNGIFDAYRYQVSTERPEGDATVTASASDPNVKVMVTQAQESGAALVRFTYNGVTKLYRLFENFVNVAVPEGDEDDVAAITSADALVGNPITVYGSGFETPDEKIARAKTIIDEMVTPLGVEYEISNTGGDNFALTYKKGDTSMTVNPFFIVVEVNTVTVEGYTGLAAEMDKTVLDVGDVVNVGVDAIMESGERIDITGNENLGFTVRDTAIATYADGKLTANAMGKTYLDIVYTDAENNRLGLNVEITVGNEVEPAASVIKVNGKTVPDYAPSVTAYTLAAPVAPELDIDVELPAEGLSYAVTAPAEIPGAAVVTVTSVWGKSRVYTLNLREASVFDAAQKTFTVDIGNTGDVEKKLRVYLAAYTDADVLAEVVLSDIITVPANGCAEGVSVALTGDIKEQSVKAFLWDDKMAPYVDAFELKEPEYSIFPITFGNGELNGFGSRGGGDLSVVDTTLHGGAAGKAIHVGPDRETWGGVQFTATDYLLYPGQEYEFVVYVRSEGAEDSAFSLTAAVDANGGTEYVHLADTDISAADGWVRFAGSRVCSAGESVTVYVENADLNAFAIDEFSIMLNGRPA